MNPSMAAGVHMPWVPMDKRWKLILKLLKLLAVNCIYFITAG
jgi:hypothetical protein